MRLGDRSLLPAIAIQWLLLADGTSGRRFPAKLWRRDDCTTQTVVSGDGCDTLASKCGISGDDFTKYNSDPNLCSTLAVGQRVWCSGGALPDIRPKPKRAMCCASYVVQAGDTCSDIAAKNGLKAEDLAKFNDGTTWGWSGCDQLGAEMAICLSEGSPPMPQTIENAVCGPLKPGTERPAPGIALADLNPCPLNSCCTRWGQCGITPEFCTNETGPTGNPGTAPTGKNGCISNCGTDIKNNDAGPSSHMSIGYYESWNGDRECLNMRVDSVDTSKYTHYHWGFATIDDTFAISINDTYKQWDKFTGLSGIKKIVSFGGWGFSTDPSTYHVLRDAMKPGEQDNFVNAVVAFVAQHNIDGVDFDWEYPSAKDIPGIPPGDDDDTANYLVFLKNLRSRLPSDKSISIAAPASYWYLKPFPIKDMAEVLDYIVYMTYDLHGQWDYNNKWSQDGCPAGNCLRSHVNLTETMYALAMITKAGVQSNKIAVGISSYGRSFGMTQAGCAGDMCTFGGPESTAEPGMCTNTPGYISNAEIGLIIAQGDQQALYWYDTGSNSDIMAWGDKQWVAYMSENTRISRTDYYKSLNFAGTVDWAVDLLAFTDDSMSDDDEDADGEDPDPVNFQWPDCPRTFDNLHDLDGASDIPSDCASYYTVQALLGSLKVAAKNYTDMLADGYDHKFNTYAHAVADKADKTIADYVNAHGNDYFTCTVGEFALCCSGCAGQNGNGKADPCKRCFDGKCYKKSSVLKRDDLLDGASNDTLSIYARDHPPPPQDVLDIRPMNVSEPCPPDYSQRGYGPDNPYEQSVWWSLNSDKADKFYADLLENTGIAKDKIKWGDRNRGNGCAPANHKGDGDSCWLDGYDYNFPMPDGYSASDVSNPKDVVQKALDSSNNLVQQVSDARDELEALTYLGVPMELVDTISIPVLMIINAIEEMAQVEEVGEKIEEEKKKAMILAFIGAILFFIPIAGEVIGSLTELGDIAAILAIVAAVGDTAMGVYQIVDDPSNPLLGIMSVILAPLGLADIGAVTKAARLRRGMSADDITKLGGKIADRMNIVKKVVGQCKKV